MLLWVCSVSLKGCTGLVALAKITQWVCPRRGREPRCSLWSLDLPVCLLQGDPGTLERGLECSSLQPGEVGEDAPCAFHVHSCHFVSMTARMSGEPVHGSPLTPAVFARVSATSEGLPHSAGMMGSRATLRKGDEV